MNAMMTMGRFTLGQCMGAIALAALVLAAALPTLNGHLMHSHREDARAALLKATQWMEQTATALGHYPGHRIIPREVLAVEGGRYVISVQSVNGLDFTLTATPVGRATSRRVRRVPRQSGGHANSGGHGSSCCAPRTTGMLAELKRSVAFSERDLAVYRLLESRTQPRQTHTAFV